MTNYALEGPKWAGPIVTWSFATAGDALSAGNFTGSIGTAYQATIRSAAAQWNAVANVTLQEVAPGTPGTDISVGWGSFGGTQVGATDYSYASSTAPSFLPGMTIRIEDPALLPLGTSAGATYAGTSTTLAQVALHEFGHALGLGLSTDPAAVMNLALGPGNTALNDSDRAGIAALYGSKAKVTAAMVASPGTDTVSLHGNDIGIYRFFDSGNGTQFMTSSVSEMNAVFSSRPDLRFEGLSILGLPPGSGDPNAAPVYRFFDSRNGSHFFTASQSEANALAATRPDLVAEQPSFYEHLTAQAGDAPVFRFFDASAGTHFFTADATERATITATRPDMTYEGVAFYAPSAA